MHQHAPAGRVVGHRLVAERAGRRRELRPGRAVPLPDVGERRVLGRAEAADHDARAARTVPDHPVGAAADRTGAARRPQAPIDAVPLPHLVGVLAARHEAAEEDDDLADRVIGGRRAEPHARLVGRAALRPGAAVPCPRLGDRRRDPAEQHRLAAGLVIGERRSAPGRRTRRRRPVSPRHAVPLAHREHRDARDLAAERDQHFALTVPARPAERRRGVSRLRQAPVDLTRDRADEGDGAEGHEAGRSDHLGWQQELGLWSASPTPTLYWISTGWPAARGRPRAQLAAFRWTVRTRACR